MTPRHVAALAVGLSAGCGEGLPEVSLQLSKNCNEVEIQPLVAQVAAGAGEQVLDIAADGSLGDTAWVLVRRPTEDLEDELLVQRVGPNGIDREIAISIPASAASALSLHPASESGEVWVVRDEPGRYQLLRVAPDDPDRPLLGSDNFALFPPETTLCNPCDPSAWPRYLVFLPGGPVVVAVPPFSIDAGLIVWVGQVDLEGASMRLGNEHRLNFEPPCEDESPAGQVACDDDRMTLIYPEITVLGVQQDPRQTQTVMFGHRTRNRLQNDVPIPIDSADVFMVSVFLDSNGTPAGVLRSYSGSFSQPPGSVTFPPLPSTDPPRGVAIDRFASYGMFSNGGEVTRLVQLPDSNPDFVELSNRIELPVSVQLLQLDRDLAIGELVDGGWELTKLFPDDPSQSERMRYTASTPITEIVSGGIGTFLVRKQDAPPEVLRVRCPNLDVVPLDEEQ
ncbi:MAG: hypothetical protein K0V04_06485 [Deltaproteobacteria bacterium]|nr:hypothetical protein [Deltaproteobacteria bacterium]